METSKLPVYNAARELYLQIHRSTQKVPRSVRYGKIAEVEGLVLSLMEAIAFANDAREVRERLQFIDKSKDMLRRVVVMVRCIRDLGFLRSKSFSAIIRYEDSLARQLSGWERKTLSDAR